MASQVVPFFTMEVVKNLPADTGDTRDAGLIPGSGRPLPEKEIANHSSIPTWKIPWAVELDGLQSLVLQRLRRGLVTKQQKWSSL